MKAILQKMVAPLPGAAQLYYFAQKYVLKTLPYDDSTLRARQLSFDGHLRFLKAQGRSPAQLSMLEMGAGWDLFSAVNWHLNGVRNQVTWDIQTLFRREMFNHNIERLVAMKMSSGKRLPLLSPNWRRELSQSYGINYRVSSKLLDSVRENERFDLVHSTSVLEHVPTTAIETLLQELRKVLKLDGLVSFIIDLSDHYSHSDSSISPVNFLTYPKKKFWANNRFLFQNRLRKSDYLNMFERAGYELVFLDERTFPPIDVQLENLDPSFRDYPAEDLAVTYLHIGARLSQTLH